jgi:hypothetical protein
VNRLPDLGLRLFRLFIISSLLLALAFVPQGALARRAAPTPSPTATPTVPPEDPAVTLIARREFVAWQAGVVDPARYAPAARVNLGADRVAATSKALGAAGVLEKTEWVEPALVEGHPDVKGYIYRMVCSEKPVYERLILGADGKIDGIVFMDKLVTDQQ